MTRKLALLIGINTYLYMEDHYQLSGCVNDAKFLKSVLINKFNFNNDDIVTLYDEDATRDNIKKAMNDLLSKVQRDDIVVFHFSGHGHECRVKTTYSDKASGKINAILPCDDSEPKPCDSEVIWREIREDYIQSWLKALAEKTPNTTLIFDACHSGTMTRAFQTSTARSVPHCDRQQVIIADNNEENNVDSINLTHQHVSQNSGLQLHSDTSSWLKLSDSYVVISACRDTQKAKEKLFTEGELTYKHGVLSYVLCNELLKVDKGMTYRDIFETISRQVKSLIGQQNPQIEGQLDKVIFGVEDHETESFLPISAVQDGQLTLDGGAAHGLHKGLTLGVYPPKCKVFSDANKIAEIQVTKVFPLTSAAIVKNSTAQPVSEGCRCAVENKEQNNFQVALFIEDKGIAAESVVLRGLCQSSKFINLVNSADQAIIIARAITDQNKVYWAFTDDTGLEVMARQDLSRLRVPEYIKSKLEKYAGYRNLLELVNPTSQLNVEFNLFVRQKDGTNKLINDRGNRLDEDVELVLEIINRDPARIVFFSLFWLSDTGSITNFYPYRKSCEELRPDTVVRIGEGDRKLSLSIPSASGHPKQSTIKAMFSSKEVDFSWLNQKTVRSFQGENGMAVEIDNAFNNLQTNQTHGTDWQAINRSFLISGTNSCVED